MKRFFFLILFLIVILCLFISCEKKNLRKKSNTTSLTDSVTYNPLCDSIYLGEFIVYVDENDTIINGTKYAYIIVVSEKHIVAFREYSEEYGMFRYMELITNGVSSILYGDSESYFESFLLSPNNRYVFFCGYYETMDIKDYETTILRFGSGYIFDVEKADVVYSLSSSEVSGYWTFCNQWVVNGKVIFDPADNLE